MTLGASRGPRGLVLESRLCLAGNVLVEERAIGRAVQRQEVSLPLDLATAPPVVDDSQGTDDPADVARRALAESRRHALGVAMGRLFAMESQPRAIFALVRDDVAARAVVLHSLSVRAQRTNQGSDGQPVDALFAQDLAAAPWIRVWAPPGWSSSGVLLSLSYWPYGDWVPTVGYSQHASVVYRSSTLDVAWQAPGWVPVFEGERPVLSSLVERCGKTPRSLDELAVSLECGRHSPRGVYERWEAVVELPANTAATPTLVRAIGPFVYSDMCGESGPPDVFARKFTGC